MSKATASLLARAGSLLTMLLACLSLLGWRFGVESLKSVFPGLVTMKVNTACSLFCIGLSLGLQAEHSAHRWRLRTARALALVPIGIGALTLLEHAFRTDLGIDTLLMRILSIATDNTQTRMSPSSATCCLLSGSAVCMLDSTGRVQRILVQTVSSVTLVIALLAGVSYAFRIVEFYAPIIYAPMALDTAVAFVLCASGTLAARERSAWLRFSAWPLRAKMVTLLLVVSLLPFTLYALLETRATATQVLGTEAALLGSLTDQLAATLDQFNADHQRLAAHLSSDAAAIGCCQALDERRLESRPDASQYREPELLAAALLDTQGRVRWSTLPELRARDLSQQPAVTSALAGAATISDVHITRLAAREEPVIMYLAPVRSSAAAVSGAAVIWVRMSAIWTRMQRLNDLAGRSQMFRGYSPALQSGSYSVARRLVTTPWTVFYTVSDDAVRERLAPHTSIRALVAALLGAVAFGVGVFYARLSLLPEAVELTRRSEERFRTLVAGVKDYAIFLLDTNGFIATWNDGAERLKGYTEQEVIGKHHSMFYTEADRARGHMQAALDTALREGRFEEEGVRVRKDGSQFWANVLITPLYDKSGRLEGFAKVTRDHTERRKHEEALHERQVQLSATLREREVLLQEIHHRVKNNLQVIASLLNMQMRKITDKPTRLALEQSKARVQAIALIHEQLYRSKNYASVAFSDYVRTLARSVFQTLGTSPTNVKLQVDVESITLSVDKAIPCGLILSELITNALKHAFPADRAGTVKVELRNQKDSLCLSVSDDGVGIAETIIGTESQSLGMQLVTTLVEQVQGKLSIERTDGTRFQVVLPLEPALS